MANVAFLGLGSWAIRWPAILRSKAATTSPSIIARGQGREMGKQFGGKSAPTPEAAAEGDSVFSCVGNDNDLREVTIGPNGAFATMRKAQIFIDHTTASAEWPASSPQPRESGGFDFVDAPVSGGQAGAENGVLTVMCGRRSRPISARRTT